MSDGPAQMGTGQLLAAMGQGAKAGEAPFKMYFGTMFDTSPEPSMVGGMGKEIGQLSPPVDYGHLAAGFNSRNGGGIDV
ncbi:MAG TPA: hypothetical protein DIV86_02005 [Alphaproteobacteria bacterium]|nr:hypothetical protein [Alphaproteobacteria bacterium]